MKEATMGAVLRFMEGLIFGVLVGAAVALLFAPRRGVETQRMIQERVQAIVAEGQEAAETRRLELTERFESLKHPSA